MRGRTQGISSAGGGPGVGINAPGYVMVPGGTEISPPPGMRERLKAFRDSLSWRSRAEPPASPQTENAPRPSWANPRGLIAVRPSGASSRENRLADDYEVSGWTQVAISGPVDGGMNYGPPPGRNFANGFAYEIAHPFKNAILGWAGLQQMGYIQDQRGSAEGYGAYLPHPYQPYAGRGVRSISMSRINSPRPYSSDKIHVPAIFVPTAPI